MKVLKFGGTSVANAQNIRLVAEIARNAMSDQEAIVLVVSALGGVTDQLIDLATKASAGKDYEDDLKVLTDKHRAALFELVGESIFQVHWSDIDQLLEELNDALGGIAMLKELSPRSLDLILSFGERMSSVIVTKAIDGPDSKAHHVDAREVMRTDDRHNMARINFDESNEQIAGKFNGASGIYVMGGFIASNARGITTTLGRGGSDYSASIVGAAIDAAEIQIWTDVEGVFTADPRFVSNAFSLKSISYEEAAELAHFGAKVIHPKTMRPARIKQIPITIKNTFKPEAPGTRIHVQSERGKSEITGVTYVKDIALLRLQSTVSKQLTEITTRIFDILNRHQLEVLLTTQASSEHALCIGLSKEDAEKAKHLIEAGLSLEIQAKMVSHIQVETGLAIVAVVGEHMKGVPGISGRFFDVLGRQGINIKAIAQGSSELNISAVIETRYIKRALNAIHNAFFQYTTKSIHLFMVGFGLVGKRLLELIKESAEFHRNQLNLDIRVWGIANSRKMYFPKDGGSVEEVLQGLDNGVTMNMHDFIAEMVDRNLPNTVFVDSTASEEVPRHYSAILKNRISLVTPNKKANSGKYAIYTQLQDLARTYHVSFKYETNVGAALPIIKTIHQLHQTGDTIHEIQGVLSGTLSYIFNTFGDSDASFSQIVREAQEKGYTEPDPRDDLNGMDVMRKILILARECGHGIEPEDVSIKPILNEECLNAPDIDAFFSALELMDTHFDLLRQQAKQRGIKWCFIASWKDGQATVALEEIDHQHPFFSLQGSDNIVSISTNRYHDSPLVIRGHGAGADVTASGVLSDIIETLTRI